MELPLHGAPEFLTGKHPAYHAFHEDKLQIEVEKWQNPEFLQRGMHQARSSIPLAKSNRKIWSESDVKPAFEAVLEQLPRKCTFGSSAGVEIDRQGYWFSDSGESLKAFFTRINPDTVVDLGNLKVVVVEYKSFWPPKHDLFRLLDNVDLLARLLGMSLS